MFQPLHDRRTVRAAAVGIDQAENASDADGAEPVERVRIVKIDGLRPHRVAREHVRADRATHRFDLRHRKAGAFEHRLDDARSLVLMIDVGLAERCKRGHIVQVGGCIEHIVVERHLVRRRELLRELIVAHRMRQSPRRMLEVGLGEAMHCGAPVARVLDGWRGRIRCKRSADEIHDSKGGEQREAPAAIQD